MLSVPLETLPITSFYSEALGANLANSRWSWGAYDPVEDHIYLRVWKDEIEDLGGSKRVLILDTAWLSKGPGKKEREDHIQKIRNGTHGFGVVCVPKTSSTNGLRTIKSFDRKSLIQLGEIHSDGRRIYAAISGDVPVETLMKSTTSLSTLPEDLKGLFSRKLPESTDRQALILARVGQGDFRKSVLRDWGHRCAVTGSTTTVAIRASHIKPWRSCSDPERLDPHNGIPLVATVDALFDSGLISFSDDGEMLISNKLEPDERAVLGIANLGLRRRPAPEMVPYLRVHRETHGFNPPAAEGSAAYAAARP